MAERIQYAGEYHIKGALIVTPAGNSIDVSGTAIEFNIYEDIFVTGLYGDITIIDVDNIAESTPIIGQEFLAVNITTPGLEDIPIQHNFSIYAVTRREDLSKGGQLLKLSFCSPEVVRNERIRVQRSFVNTIDNIISSILINELKTEKKFSTEVTAGIRNIVSPNFHPHSLINRLTAEAVSQSHAANHFLFYENLHGIHFHSLEYLYSKSHIQMVESDGMDSAGGEFEGKKQNPLVDFQRPLSFQINSNNHLLSNIRNGLLGSTMTSYNIFRKNYNIYTYDYFDEFYKTPRTNTDRLMTDGGEFGSFPMYSDGAIDKDSGDVGDFPDSRIHLTSISSASNDGIRYDMSHSVDIFANTDGEYPFIANGMANMLSRDSKLTELSGGISVTMKLHGHTKISVGELIEVRFPPPKGVKGVTTDRYLSGKFLITKARHTFDNANRKHTVTLLASSDDLRKKLPRSNPMAKEMVDDATQKGPRRTHVA